jgi:transitional endoplasmic reticulum ATPase
MAVKANRITRTRARISSLADTRSRAVNWYMDRWILRSLQNATGIRRLHRELKDGGYDDICSYLGIRESALARLPESRVKATLEGLIDAANNSTRPENCRFLKNRDRLGKLFQLSSLEKDLILLATILPGSLVLKDCIHLVGDLNLSATFRYLGMLLDKPVKLIETALKPGGTLQAGGLISFDMSREPASLTERLSSELEYSLSLNHAGDESLISSFVNMSPAARLGLKDFTHLQADLDILVPLLEQALVTQTPGVNILVFGSPGVGKTELGRALAGAIGTPLYQVPNQTVDGEGIGGVRRLSCFLLAQNVLSRRENCVLLFDEVEDVFPPEQSWLYDEDAKATTRDKGWFNQVLETNAVPALWLCNNTQRMDPAFLRRFKYVVEVPQPSYQVRLSILNQYLADLPVSPEWKKGIASEQYVSPALIENSAGVARMVAQVAPGRVEEVFERTLRNTLSVMGVQHNFSPRRHTRYNLDHVNADSDLHALVSGLRRQTQGRICLYGPPGTGKTAYARELSRLIDKQLMVVKASDLLDKYVGESEKNLSEVFKSASRQQAILLLDEADSFLQDRRFASQHWETTLTNELLTQMEAFEGIFVCTTNLMQNLDPATLRRFDFKVKLDYLRKDQVWRMFCDALAGLGIDHQVAEHCKAAVTGLEKLTPGDFENALRQQTILGEDASPEWLLSRLVKECSIKPAGMTRGIGFVS